MKKKFSLFLILCSLLAVFCLSGCQPQEQTNENQPTRNIVELTEYNFWQYLDISISDNGCRAGSKDSINCKITGVLDYALYENVVISFDVFYYTDEQAEEEYGSYIMFIALNAAGNAEFETTYLGTTDVTLGKWNGVEGELVNLNNYNRKIYMKSITGKVIYTI